MSCGGIGGSRIPLWSRVERPLRTRIALEIGRFHGGLGLVVGKLRACPQREYARPAGGWLIRHSTAPPSGARLECRPHAADYGSSTPIPRAAKAKWRAFQVTMVAAPPFRAHSAMSRS